MKRRKVAGYEVKLHKRDMSNERRKKLAGVKEAKLDKVPKKKFKNGVPLIKE